MVKVRDDDFKVDRFPDWSPWIDNRLNSREFYDEPVVKPKTVLKVGDKVMFKGSSIFR